MTPEQENLLLKAERKLASAKLSLRGGFPEDTASRAYYAMLYVAQAILANEGLENKTHRGVLAAFGKNFARTGIVPLEFHRKLIDAEKLRIKADYGVANAVTNEEARQQIEYGEQFIKLSNQLITKPHY